MESDQVLDPWLRRLAELFQETNES